MARIKIEAPDNYPFSTVIKVRISDINYGGHVGNDAILSLVHEARMQFLAAAGYTEMNLAGCSLIMSDAGIEFKAELFYGDVVQVYVAASGFSKVAFDIFYKLEKTEGEKKVLVSLAKTGMVCYDYTARKITALPGEVMARLTAG